MICLCLNSNSLENNNTLIKQNQHAIDLIELRVDFLEKQYQQWSKIECWAKNIKSTTNFPIIFTIRLPQDGGLWNENSDARLQLLLQAAKSTLFNWIDIEATIHAQSNSPVIYQLLEAIDSTHTQLIISGHYFLHTPKHPLDSPTRLNELWVTETLSLAKKYPTTLIKTAVFCANSSMLCDFIEQSNTLTHKIPKQYICVPMGLFGMLGRVLTIYTGSCWTYTSEPSIQSQLSQLGHISPVTMKNLYQYKNISLDTQLYTIIGNPVLHSQSPAFHNEIFNRAKEQKLGKKQNSTTNKVYLHLPLDDVSVLPRLASLINLRGLSVTIPHKESVLPLLHDCENQVSSCNTCNTILIDNDKRWYGYNTDITGFLIPLYKTLHINTTPLYSNKNNKDSNETALDFSMIPMPLQGYSVTIIGAGGTAKAIGYSLMLAGAKLLLVNRTISKADTLAHFLNKIHTSLVPATQEKKLAHTRHTQFSESKKNIDYKVQTAVLSNYSRIAQFSDIIIQASSLGMNNNTETPLPHYPFTGKEIVYDVVYTPPLTKIMHDAQNAGCVTISGEKMFLAQAKLQSELFVSQL